MTFLSQAFVFQRTCLKRIKFTAHPWKRLSECVNRRVCKRCKKALLLSLADIDQQESLKRLAMPDIGKFFFEPTESVCFPDNRQQILTTEDEPWSGICLLVISLPNGRHAVGTGWLVSPTMVVTAGHCVHHGKDGEFFSQIEIIPGANGLLQPFQSKTVSNANFRASNGWVADGSVEDDYGAIILEQPFASVNGKTPFVFEVANLTNAQFENAKVSLSGYPADKPVGTNWTDSGPLDSVKSKRLLYSIDTFGGHSGSPVDMLVNGKRVVVGIHNYGNCPNKCTRITADVVRDLQSWANESRATQKDYGKR